MTKSICLVSCVSKKRPQASPAKDLYISALFKKSRVWAEDHSDRWFILSAKYGLTDPEKVIEPYEQTLNRMSAFSRREWSSKIGESLRQVLQPGDTVIFLAGMKYRDNLESVLRQHGVQVRVPMEGMRIGEQLSWLSGSL